MTLGSDNPLYEKWRELIGYLHDTANVELPDKLEGDNAMVKAINGLIEALKLKAEMIVPDEPVEGLSGDGVGGAGAGMEVFERVQEMIEEHMVVLQAMIRPEEYILLDDALSDAITAGIAPRDIKGDDIWIQVTEPEASQDYTGYTETDVNLHVTVTAAEIAYSGMHSNEDVRVYKDFTADHFESGDFVASVATKCDAAQTGRPTILALSNVVAGRKAWDDSNDEVWDISWSPGAGASIRVDEQETAAGDLSTALAFGTWYYLYITWVGTTLTIGIYADEYLTSLVDTIAVTLPSGRKYRYAFALNNWNLGVEGVPGAGNNKDLNLDRRLLISHIWPASAPGTVTDTTAPLWPCGALDGLRLDKGNIYAYHHSTDIAGSGGWFLAEDNSALIDYVATGAACAGNYNDERYGWELNGQSYYDKAGYKLWYNGSAWEISDDYTGGAENNTWVSDTAGTGGIISAYTQTLGGPVTTTVAAG